MSEPYPSARDLWNLRTYQLEGVVLDPNTDPPVREAVQQLLRYRTRYGDIDAPPYTPPVFDNEIAEGASRQYAAFVKRRDEIHASMQPDAPPKSPQPVAGGCEWLGECEPTTSPTEVASRWTDHAKEAAYYRKMASQLSRIDVERARELKAAQDDINALRAEVERRDEIIACEVGLRQRAEGERDEALCTAVRRSDTNRELADRALRAEACTDALFVERDTAKAEAARYRAAIVECISDGRGEADMLRAIAWALLTQQERGA